jgi:hypothetical protein
MTTRIPAGIRASSAGWVRSYAAAAAAADADAARVGDLALGHSVPPCIARCSRARFVT